jgi:hypothetical protein
VKPERTGARRMRAATAGAGASRSIVTLKEIPTAAGRLTAPGRDSDVSRLTGASQLALISISGHPLCRVMTEDDPVDEFANEPPFLRLARAL